MLDQQALRESVQKFEPDTSGLGLYWFGVALRQPDLLPEWGNPRRDYALRQLWYMAIDTVVGAAFMGFTKRIQSTPWEVVGGRNTAARFQRMFQAAQFGGGWDVFMPRLMLDYLTQDKGAFIELIYAGEPNSDPRTRPVLGIAHLDSLRCTLTGNEEFPVIYQDRDGALHRMHRSRIVHLVDTPDAEERAYNYGHCALSRLATITHIQRNVGKYQNEKLNDLPPAGLMTVSGVSDAQFKQAIGSYNAQSAADANNVWRNIIRVSSADAAVEAKINFIPFSQVPDHFNYRELVELHINAVSLALGVDVQEFWQLGGGVALGTATQSMVLAEKARGKGYGHLLQMLERVFNTRVLPEALEFRFKFRDSDADSAEAERAEKWVNIISAAPGLSTEQRLQMLANNVGAFADVLLNEDGTIKLPDSDARDPQQQTEVIAEDDTTPGTQDDAVVSDDAPRGEPTETDVERAYTDTADEFVRNLSDLLKAGTDKDVTRRRFGTVFRAQLSRLGRKAYLDGLREGGVETDALEGDDATALAKWLAAQSKYVTDFSASLYAKDGALNLKDFEARARMWANKSLYEAYALGLESSDSNAAYKWVLGDAEHCSDCKRLANQVHRLKAWRKSGWLPKSDRLSCGGFNCKCSLVKTRGRSKGEF